MGEGRPGLYRPEMFTRNIMQATILIQNVPVATFESKEIGNINLNNGFYLTQYIQNMIISICTNIKITSELFYVFFPTKSWKSEYILHL